MHSKTRIKDLGIYIALFALSFYVGLFLQPILNGDSLKADTLTNKYDSVEKLEDVIVQYHLNVNAIMNDYLERLISSDDIELGMPPENGECTPENVSTYCLAMELNEELHLFEQSLLLRQNEFEDAFNNKITIEEATALHSNRVQLINDELNASRAALDLSLAVYNEVQIVYPLHQKFQELIVELVEYRDTLGEIRDAVTEYPALFVGATTLNCK